MSTRAVDEYGRPTRATDERGILLDLDSYDVQAMTQVGEDPAAYLKERQEQLDASREKRLEEHRMAGFVAEFVAAGGTEEAARAAYARRKKEEAEAAAVSAEERADRAAVEHNRSRVSRVL